MVAVEFDSMGEAVRLALVAGEYAGGGLAVLLLDATDPRSDGYMAEWGVLTASVPAAAEWCRGRGNIAIDADVPAALLEALEAAGMLRMAGRSAASGMARYPLATVAGHAPRRHGRPARDPRGGPRLDGRRRVRVGRRRRRVRGGDRAGRIGRARATHCRREVRGGRVGGRRRMGCRPGWVRGCRDHRLRDGPDGLRRGVKWEEGAGAVRMGRAFPFPGMRSSHRPSALDGGSWIRRYTARATGTRASFSVDSTSSYRDFSISRFDLEVCNSIFLEYGTRLSFEIASCIGRLFRVRDQFFKGAKLGLY